MHCVLIINTKCTCFTRIKVQYGEVVSVSTMVKLDNVGGLTLSSISGSGSYVDNIFVMIMTIPDPPFPTPEPLYPVPPPPPPVLLVPETAGVSRPIPP